MKTPRIPLFASLGEDVSTSPLSPVGELGYPLLRGRPRPLHEADKEKPKEAA